MSVSQPSLRPWFSAKKQACSLRVQSEFKYLLFKSEGKIEHKVNRQIGEALAVMQAVYQTVVVKTIYHSIYIPIHTYGHKLWIGTKRMRL